MDAPLYIEIYGTPMCGFCSKAMLLAIELDECKVAYRDLTEDQNLVELYERTGTNNIKTVPQIFIDGQHVGGYTDMARELQQRGIIDAY